MAVETTPIDATFTGTGVSSTYSPGFYANTIDQVIVTVNGVLQTVGDDYVLNGLGDPDGIDIVAIFGSGAVVYVERDTPITQEVDTQNNETILEDVLDGALDKLTMIAQEIDGKTDRAILVPKGEEGFVLPAEADRANKFIAFDADGDVILSNGPGTDSGLRTDLASPIGTALVLASWGDTLENALRYRRDIHFHLPAGFVTDGSVDYSTQIQAAIDLYSPDGAVIHFPKGTYKANVILKRGITLKGAGQRETIIVPATNDHVIKTPTTVSTVRIGLEDIAIQGNIANVGKNGIHLETVTGGTFIDTVYLKNVYITGNENAGIYAKGVDGSGPFVQRAFFDNVISEYNNKYNVLLHGAVIESRFEDCSFCHTLKTDGTGQTVRLEQSAGAQFPSQILILNTIFANLAAYDLLNAAPGIVIQAGSNIKLINCNMEAVRPAIKLEDTALVEGFSWSGGRIAVTQNVDTAFDLPTASGRVRIQDIRFDVTGGKTLTSVAKLVNGQASVKSLIMTGLALNGTITNVVDETSAWLQTIASGNIIFYRDYISVWGEGALADDLVNITATNGSTTRFKSGDTLTLSMFDGQPVVTVKNTGNIALANGLDFILSNGSTTLTLAWSRNMQKWVEIGRTAKRAAAVTAPTGGATIDTQSRTAINDIIARLQGLGILT